MTANMKHAQATNMALGQLITNEVFDASILDAMTDIPRELFVPGALKGAAYADEDIPVGGGRYLMAPCTFAKLLTLANITPECRVLVVGALSGYTAAVAAKLASHVVAIENDAALVEQMKTHFTKLGISNIDAENVSSLADGYPLSAPYDVIILCGGVVSLGESLPSQLSIGGRLVAMRLIASRPDIRGGMGRGMVLLREHNHSYTRDRFDAPTVIMPGFM